MKTANLILAVLASGILFASVALAKPSVSVSEKASLQAAMQRHIDRSLVNGAYLHLNPKSGDVRRLHPVTAHPAILQMGNYFVLCFDFRDDGGKPVNVDFYMARKGQSYVVFHAAVENRALLGRLMKTGKVAR